MFNQFIYWIKGLPFIIASGSRHYHIVHRLTGEVLISIPKLRR